MISALGIRISLCLRQALEGFWEMDTDDRGLIGEQSVLELIMRGLTSEVS